jgi:hypothetical protein
VPRAPRSVPAGRRGRRVSGGGSNGRLKAAFALAAAGSKLYAAERGNSRMPVMNTS